MTFRTKLLRAAFGAAAMLLLPAPTVIGPRHAHAQAAPAQPAAQRAFATPEQAVRALIEAVRAPGLEPVTAILGRAALAAVPPAERQSAETRRAAGDWLAAQSFVIEYDESRRRARARFGEDRVELPAVLVHGARGWVFDTQATLAAMRERRIGVNESNAVRALQALAEAQRRYRQSLRSGDGVLQYAQRIQSRPGRSDGLSAATTDILPGPSVGLLNPAFGRAEGLPGDVPAELAGGYGYRILTAQGSSAEGGAKSFLADGRLIDGYAVVAWPLRPGVSGLSTFIMDHRGNIFEREFSAATAETVRTMQAFDPGPGWTRVEPAAP